MTAPGDHGHEWAELTAAHALHALEPEDELRLLGHLRGCADCRRTLDEYQLVAAQLGSLSTDAAPVWANLWTEAPELPAEPASTRTRRDPVTRLRWRPRLLAAAAALIALVATGVVTQHLTSAPTPDLSASSCGASPDCHLVVLHGLSRRVAEVVVSGSQVGMRDVVLSAPEAGETYVLWQLPRDSNPRPIMAFRHATDTAEAALTRPYADTVAFAISIEPASTAHVQPSHVIATGPA